MGTRQVVKTDNKKQRLNVLPVLRSKFLLATRAFLRNPCVDGSLHPTGAVSSGLWQQGLVLQPSHRVPLADAFSPRSPVLTHAVHTHGAALPAMPVV